MGISIPQLLIIVLIVALLFGTKRLRSLGSDLGEAIKGFKKSVKEEDKAENKGTVSQETLSSETISPAASVEQASTTDAEKKDEQVK